MSAKLNLIGLDRDRIAKAVSKKRPEELVDIIHELATIEPHYSPRTVARARGLSVRRVLALCKDGTIRAHKPLENDSYRIPLSAIRNWDEQTSVEVSL